MITLNVRDVPTQLMRAIRVAAANEDKTVREVVIEKLESALVLSSTTTMVTSNPSTSSVPDKPTWHPSEEDNPFAADEPKYDHSEEFAQPVSAKAKPLQAKLDHLKSKLNK